MHLLASKGHGASVKPVTDSKGTAPRKLAPGYGSLPGTTTTTSAKALAGEKPQKVLPCPRCESMNTKFCYYNNYSVNQPRHFCRQCQRYWTVGGTLRNVPVGGGSRKKHRRGATEPYPRPPGSAPTPLAMATPGLSPTMSFQQFLAHDVPGAFQFSQLPGFMPHSGPYGAYPVVDQTGQPLQYVTPLSSKAQEFPPMYGVGNNHYFPDGTTHDQSNVKAEFWNDMNITQQPQAQPVWDNPQSAPAEEKACEAAGSKSNGFESSMLLQLGLTSQVPENGAACNKGDSGCPGTWNEVTVPANSSSPPHGSSTIEEEGSTPTNGYSHNGYEEGDAVSSMWAQNMHDMQDILCSTL
jgi:hypothetical protein